MQDDARAKDGPGGKYEQHTTTDARAVVSPRYGDMVGAWLPAFNSDPSHIRRGAATTTQHALLIPNGKASICVVPSLRQIVAEFYL